LTFSIHFFSPFGDHIDTYSVNHNGVNLDNYIDAEHFEIKCFQSSMVFIMYYANFKIFVVFKNYYDPVEIFSICIILTGFNI